jgi:hypothetical protein
MEGKWDRRSNRTIGMEVFIAVVLKRVRAVGKRLGGNRGWELGRDEGRKLGCGSWNRSEKGSETRS